MTIGLPCGAITFLHEHAFAAGLTGVRMHCRSSKTIPEFQLPPEMALELLKAANYLDT